MMTLSDSIQDIGVIFVEDVKEFIKELKAVIEMSDEEMSRDSVIYAIDKLAGEELVE